MKHLNEQEVKDKWVKKFMDCSPIDFDAAVVAAKQLYFHSRVKAIQNKTESVFTGSIQPGIEDFVYNENDKWPALYEPDQFYLFDDPDIAVDQTLIMVDVNAMLIPNAYTDAALAGRSAGHEIPHDVVCTSDPEYSERMPFPDFVTEVKLRVDAIYLYQNWRESLPENVKTQLPDFIRYVCKRTGVPLQKLQTSNPLIEAMRKRIETNDYFVAAAALILLWEEVADMHKEMDMSSRQAACRGEFNYGNHEAGYMAAFELSMKDSDDEDVLKPLVDVTNELGWYLVLSGAVVMVERPIEIHLDTEGRFHNPIGPAIAMRNGWHVCAYEGVKFPNEWLKKLPEPTEALSIENVELRRVACEMLGWENILQHLGYEVVHTDPNPAIGELVLVNIPGSGPEYYLRVTEFPDGTGRKFALYLGSKEEMQINTAMEAQRLIWGLEDDEEYCPEVEA